jgi:hypothetical protein
LDRMLVPEFGFGKGRSVPLPARTLYSIARFANMNFTTLHQGLEKRLENID